MDLTAYICGPHHDDRHHSADRSEIINLPTESVFISKRLKKHETL